MIDPVLRRRATTLWIITSLPAILAPACPAQTVDTYLPWEGGAGYFHHWQYGPPSTQDYFPIGAWLQSPSNAGQFKSVGVNLYVALFRGTVETTSSGAPQLPLLRQYSMPVLGDQRTGLAGTDAAAHLTDPIIEGWTQIDEPDNAQPNPNGSGYVACVSPASIADTYRQFRAADPNRPIFLGLGQGTGWDAASPYYGRGSVCNDPSRQLKDYPLYIQGADIIASDVYPKNNGRPLWWIGRTVDRLRLWAKYQKPVWQWIELVNFNNNPSVTLSAHEIQAEVWMTIIHGGLGIGYFVHQFAPVFEENSIFHPEHADAQAAVTATNTQVTALARVLNTASVANGHRVQSSNPTAPINCILKRSGGSTFLFAINDRLPPGADPLTEAGLAGGATTGTFTLRDFPAKVTAVVLGENRQIAVTDGVFSDDFKTDYTFHLYQILFDPNPGAPSVGDLNGDGRVGPDDMRIVTAAMGTTAGQAGYDPRADVVRDGVVDSTDAGLVAEAIRKARTTPRRRR